MISRRSTFRLLPPTNGRRDNQQMVDENTRKALARKARSDAFKARWEIALKMNGLENAQVANELGESGQQNINGWKGRGRIGSQSERRVAEIFSKTNMEWLQYGDGSPERVSQHSAESSRNHDFRQDRSVRPIPEMLSSAYQYALIGLGLYAEGRDLNLALLPDAVLLCDVYALIATGGGSLPGGQESSELRATIEKHANMGTRGKQSDERRPEDDAGKPRDGRDSSQ
jgi:hypothetical protein